jgi:CheY-like chemotaxis protein
MTQNTSAATASAQSSPVRVLLVEDNEGDIFLIARALQEARFPHTLTVLRDGADAMEFLSRETPSESAPMPELVLMDLNLPRVDGTALIQLFRERAALQDIPVVLLSSSEARHDSARAQELRKGIYFVKPTELGAFMEIGERVKEFWAQSQT